MATDLVKTSRRIRCLGLAFVLVAGPALADGKLKPKVCPPPESFRAMQHLFDNTAPTLQAYPVVGVPPPVDLFKYFGKDMEPRCALERTFADLATFRVEVSKGMVVGEAFTLDDLARLHRLMYRAFKRYQWCLLLVHARAPEFEYDGSRVPELKEGVDDMFRAGLEAGKKYLQLSTAFVGHFKGLSNTAAEARKRLDADKVAAEKGLKARGKVDIEKDEKTVADYEQRLQALKKFVFNMDHASMCMRTISMIHGPAKYSWPALGSPAGLLMPMAKGLEEMAAEVRKRLEKGS